MGHNMYKKIMINGEFRSLYSGLLGDKGKKYRVFSKDVWGVHDAPGYVGI